jgi:dienelactone hydrolase
VERYAEQAVSFTSHGVTLSGTLLVPPGPGPHPAVVFVHGSGPDWREPYRSLGDYFARNGIAALIYDKRGVGASEGDWRLASFEDLADDAIAAVQLLRSNPEIDASRVGLWGISQGGWIVPLAATRSSDVAFIIPVSGSGVSPAVQELWRIGNNLRFRELSPAAIAIGLKANHMFYSLKSLAERGWITLPPAIWFRSLDLWMDPSAIWERVQQPVFGIWGEIDGLVPTSESVELVRGALDRGGNDRYTLRVFAGADHDLLQAVEGFQNERLPRIAYVDEYREAMVEWVNGLALDGGGKQVVVPAGTTPTRLGWHGSAREPTPSFGRAIVQLPLVLGLALVCLWVSAGAAVAHAVRRSRGKRAPAQPRLGRTRALAGAAGALGVVAMVGWGATLVPTMLEGGDPFIAGHPLALIVARAAAVGAALAFAVLGGDVVRFWREGRLGIETRIGYSAACVAGLVFIRWAWYWHLFPGT